jgi:hypothetical protein
MDQNLQMGVVGWHLKKSKKKKKKKKKHHGTRPTINYHFCLEYNDKLTIIMLTHMALTN